MNTTRWMCLRAAGWTALGTLGCAYMPFGLFHVLGTLVCGGLTVWFLYGAFARPRRHRPRPVAAPAVQRSVAPLPPWPAPDPAQRADPGLRRTTGMLSADFVQGASSRGDIVVSRPTDDGAGLDVEILRRSDGGVDRMTLQTTRWAPHNHAPADDRPVERKE